MSEWRIGTGSHPSPSLPSQYMRKINTIPTIGVVTTPVQPSTSNHILGLPNGNLDNASAKKRWLRQAISEEIDPPPVPHPNSRPNSPVGVECLAPLKKRRLARASMSSEVSNTPPSTPNNTDVVMSEMDHETVEDTEQQQGHQHEEEEEEERHEEPLSPKEPPPPKMIPSRKWSCSEVSSAEEDLDDHYPDDIHEDMQEETAEESNNVTHSTTEEQADALDEKAESNKSNCAEGTSPSRSTTPRRSRWDQVDAPEPVLNSSNSNSPVKSTSDAIVLDYVRNPEQYAKLTAVAPVENEKGANVDKEPGVLVRQHETGETEEHSQPGSLSAQLHACRRNLSGEGIETPVEKTRVVSENVESSPKTPTQVKKKVRFRTSVY